MLPSVGSQRVGHNSATEQQKSKKINFLKCISLGFQGDKDRKKKNYLVSFIQRINGMKWLDLILEVIEAFFLRKGMT